MSYLRVPKIYVGISTCMKYGKIGISINESRYRLAAYSKRALCGTELNLVFETMVEDFKYHDIIEENMGLYRYTYQIEQDLLSIIKPHIVWGRELFEINKDTISFLNTFINSTRISHPSYVLFEQTDFCDYLLNNT